MKKDFKKREKPYFQALFPKKLDCYFLQITNSQPNVKKRKISSIDFQKICQHTDKQTDVQTSQFSYQLCASTGPKIISALIKELLLI